MADDYKVVSAERHQNKRWIKYTNYDFARQSHLTEIALAEIGPACRSFPLAFVRSGENTSLLAILGTSPGTNTFVASNGQWLGLYTPATFRTYPFKLAQSPDGKRVLCVNEALNNVVDVGDAPEGKGERFFEEDGTPSDTPTKIGQFLNTMTNGITATKNAAKLLDEHELLEPWELELTIAGKKAKFDKLLKVNEPKMQELDGEVLQKLLKAGALGIAYGQLFSIGTVPVLTNLAEAAVMQAQAIEQQNRALFDDVDDDHKIDWDQLLGD